MPTPLPTLPKDEKEQACFDRFRLLFPAFPSCTVRKMDEKTKEGQGAPDFLLETPKVIGIELTELFSDVTIGPLPLQAQESLRHQLLDDANQIFQGLCQARLFVSVSFNSRVNMAKQRVRPLSQALANIVYARV